ncbi:MAG TPA: MFS transporter [Acidobacteriota bacterium]|nr:MFS transporter [Acidobacteriota bacterium]
MNEPTERLPLRNRLLYASGSISGNAIGRSLDLFFLFFYAPPADAEIAQRVPIVLAGVVISGARLLEAFDDPLIGFLSDRTRSRWGRRIPYVLVATPFLSLFFVLLWMPPDAHESFANVVYLFVVLWFFHLFSTLSGGPFESLLPEIAPRADDRLSIVSWQVVFGVVGAVFGLIVASVLKSMFGFQTMAVVLGGIALGSRYLALAGAWRPAMRTAQGWPQQEHMESFWAAIATSLRNDQFVVFLPSFILYNMGVQMITGVLPFLTAAVLERGIKGSADIAIPGISAAIPPVEAMLGVAILTVIVALPFMVRYARHLGKRWVYARGMLVAAIVFPLLFFVGLIPGPAIAQALVFAALIGVPLAAVQTFPNALIADITDYDTLQTGMRREATYYATQAMFEKVASAFAPALLALLLFVGSTVENPLGVRLVGPVAGAATLVGYLVFRRYWLPDTVTEETVREAGR